VVKVTSFMLGCTHGRLLLRVCFGVVIGHRVISSPDSAKPQLNAELAEAPVVM
jgi:hypothetical protein